jgi:hypothetical protein
MFINTWGEIFTVSLQNLWLGFINFVPSLLGAIIIFIVGWMLASIVGKAVTQLLDTLKLDRVFASAGLEDFLKRAGMRLHVGGFIGALVKWFIAIVFLMTSFEIIGLTQVNDFLREVIVSYLPQVIIAALVLVVASVVAQALDRVVKGSAKAANVASARALGAAARYAVWIFAVVVALDKLGIFQYFGQILFAGLVVMLSLAFGLAFGLGGKEAAARAIEKVRGEMHGGE